MQLRPTPARAVTSGAALLAALTIVACGGSSSSSSSSSGSTPAQSASTPGSSGGPVALSISETGAKAAFTAPASIPGGLVTLQLTNKGSKPHGAQLFLLRGNHTAVQLLQVLGSNSDTTPSWLRAEGGVSEVPPGQTGNSVLNLAPGHYVVTELLGRNPGPPAYRELTVTAGAPGSLPTTAATVTAAKLGKDRWAWQTSGLKPGVNQVTFKSEGTDSLHVILAGRINPGANPSLAQIKQSLAKGNGPPPFADKRSLQKSAVLDGGSAQVTALDLKPGTYVLFCPLPDRNGGKPHFLQGMLTKVKVG